MKTARLFSIVTTVLMSVLFSIAVSMVVPVYPLLLAVGLLAFYVAILVIMKAVGGTMPRGFVFATTAYSCSEVAGTAPAAYTVAGDCLEQSSSAIGLFAIKKGFDVSTVIDITTYAAAKTAKDIIPIKDVEAFWPVATPVYVPSVGGRPDRLTRIDYEMPFKYENVDDNLHFQNTLNHSRNFGLGFVTEEYKVFAPLDRDLEAILCNWFAAPNGEQEYGKNRFMQGTIKWKGTDLVQLVEYAGFAKAIIKPDFQP